LKSKVPDAGGWSRGGEYSFESREESQEMMNVLMPLYDEACPCGSGKKFERCCGASTH
jgi:hypothetical protein